MFCGSYHKLDARRPGTGTRQDFVAEAVASRKSVGSWELVVGT
jgi:hypothetical protein